MMFKSPSISSISRTALLLAGVLGLQACTQESDGFSLPEGDRSSGMQAFTKLGCNGCHIAYSPVSVQIERLGQEVSTMVNVPLGGQTTRYRTQGDLVASVINPDHKMSRRYDRSAATTNSPMVSSNTVMTVQELIDLVAFLQEEYEIKTPRTWSEK
jgi:sulfur-oxidizing protein SoxX